MTRADWSWLLAPMLGCAGSAALAPDALPRPDAAQVERLQRLAPDLYARADAVRSLALVTHDPDAAEEHRARAALLFEAATLEADRLELDARRQALFVEAAGEELGRKQALLSIAELESNRRLQQASAAAAARTPPAATDARGLHAWRLERAKVLLGAALMLGAPPDVVQLAENALLAAEIDSDRSPVAAERALSAAERALGAARARQPAPGAQEIAAFTELGRERGLTVQPSVEGARVELRAAYRGASGALTATGREQLTAVLSLLRAHPHGEVQVLADSAGARAALTRVLAPEAGARLVVQPNTGGAAQPERGNAVLLFRAYRLAPEQAEATSNRP